MQGVEAPGQTQANTKQNADQRQASYNKKAFDPRGSFKQKDRCSKCGDSSHLEGFTYPAKSTNVGTVINLATLPASAL